jgi:hypothetical protein
MFAFAHVPRGVLSGAEYFLTCFTFLIVFHREQSVDSVGVRAHRNVWMLSFLLLMGSCLSSCVAALSSCLLSGVRSRCQLLQESSFFYDLLFY